MGLFSPFNPFNPFNPGGSSSRSSSPFDFGSNEKRDETRRLISDAKDLVSRGEDIIYDAEREMNRAQEEAETAIDDYSSLCREVSNKLGNEVAPVIEQFRNFDIDTRVTAPEIGSFSIPSIHISMSSFAESFRETPSILDIFLNEYQYDKAKEQHEAAKAYYKKAKATCEKMRSARDRMNEIKKELNSDGKQVRALSDKVVSIAKQLKTAMSRSSFTQEQADYLKNINQIATIICQHLSMDFLNSDLTIKSTFKQQASAMKKLNDSIPSSPRLDDQRLLFALRDLHDFRDAGLMT